MQEAQSNGPCIFPTEGASNPTYTIFATALRCAEHLAERWGERGGISDSAGGLMRPLAVRFAHNVFDELS